MELSLLGVAIITVVSLTIGIITGLFLATLHYDVKKLEDRIQYLENKYERKDSTTSIRPRY